jgi:hypothetical protein
MKKSHTPRKPFQPRRKLTIQQVMLQAHRMVKSAFQGEVHVMIVVRHPTQEAAQFMVGDDDVDEAVGVMLRRKAAFDQSRGVPEIEEATALPAEGPRGGGKGGGRVNAEAAPKAPTAGER